MNNQITAQKESELWRAVSNQQLQLIILPTEACNFRCTYCYESFKLGKMPKPVMTAVKRHLTRRFPELKILQISWFGGEPLLALDVVENISTHIMGLLKSQGGVSYNADMTTNASLLSQKVFARLCSLGVRTYQISFDGTREEHDKRRVQVNGRPTFDQIWANLLAMRGINESFKVNARLHLDAQNLRSIPKFIAEFKREFKSDARFEIFIRPISKLGGPNDDNLPVLDHAKALEISKSFALDCEKVGVPSRTMAPVAAAPICYASRLNSWVVRSDGRLGKCTVALESASNDVGRLLPDGSLELDSQKLKPWIRGLDSRDPTELGCPLQNFSAFNNLAALSR